MRPQKRARSLPEVDDALAGLARAVERHSRMITAGRGETAALTAVVEQLSSSLRVATEAWSAPSEPADGETGQDQCTKTARDTQGDEPQPVEVLPSWLVTTDWAAGEELTTELVGWAREVYLRWPDAVLPACWALHPWVIEELWVLRCCWVSARTGETASWLRWQDWHDRQRPATARRITEGLEYCAPDQHVPASGGPYPVVPGADVVPLSVTAWATEDHQAWPPTVAAQLLDDPEPTRVPNGGTRPTSPRTNGHATAIPKRTLS
jgi:hypothetical protein